MKFLAILLLASPAFAATCPQNILGNGGKVVVNDDQTITVSGLSKSGVTSGTYDCEIQGTNGSQSKGSCNSQVDDSRIGVWFTQGVSMFGTPAASVALYTSAGQKVFESGCNRD